VNDAVDGAAEELTHGDQHAAEQQQEYRDLGVQPTSGHNYLAFFVPLNLQNC